MDQLSNGQFAVICPSTKFLIELPAPCFAQSLHSIDQLVPPSREGRVNLRSIRCSDFAKLGAGNSIRNFFLDTL